MGLRLSDYLPRASSTILLLPVLFFFILVRGDIFDVVEIIYYPFFLKPLPPLLAYCYIPQCLLAPSTTSRLTCFSGKLSLLKMFSKYFQEPPQDGIEVTCAHKPVCWLKPLLHILHVFLLLFQLPFVLGTVCEAT